MLKIRQDRALSTRPLLPSTLAPKLPATIGQPGSTLRQAVVVDHQGTVIAFARAEGSTELYYNVLELKVSTVVDNQEWSGFTKLTFPQQLRPAGLGLVTVDNQRGSVLPAAEFPPKIVSDEKYVHVFQQSSRGTLLLNRFMLKRVSPDGGGPAVSVLEPIWEVRFQRSGKEDIPDGPRDSQGYTSPDGTPYIEPTIELAMVKDIDAGRFEALILPSQASTARRWQFFAVNKASERLDLFSFAMDEDGLFDFTGMPRNEHGNVLPDASVRLTYQDTNGGKVSLALAGKPAACLYSLRERVLTSSGDDLLLKRTARVMLAQPVKQGGGALQFATIDFALGKDGRLAKLGPDMVATTINPANDALQFSNSAFLHLPQSPSLVLAGSFKADFWVNATSAGSDQYIFRGDHAVEPKSAAPYVKITPDLHVAAGFGTGTESVEARTDHAVIVPSQWAHLTVEYNSSGRSAAGDFSIFLNGNALPVTGGHANGPAAGNAITTISGQESGLIGVLDALKIWNTGGTAHELVGDWPFDSVDYGTTPPTTPDASENKNDATVHGAVLVPCTAPNSEDTQGNLVVDENGLSSYTGLLTFANPGDSPSLSAGSDGLVHLYFAGMPDVGAEGRLSVAQYDATSARAVFDGNWQATTPAGTENGTFQFTAARSGSFMNLATMAVTPSKVAGLCDVALNDMRGRHESWLGVPRALERFMNVLNGNSTFDPSDPGLRSGTRTFYDNTGSYASTRLKVSSQGTDAAVVLLSSCPSALQLGSAGVSEITGSTCELTLTFTVAQWTEKSEITQSWKDVSVFAGSLLAELGGTSPGYDYSNTDSSTSPMCGLAASDSTHGNHELLLIGRAGAGIGSVNVTESELPGRCTAAVTIHDEGERNFTLKDIPRDQVGFAAAINDHPEAGLYLLAVTDALTASVDDFGPAMPAKQGMRSWGSLLVVFPEEPLAPDAIIAAQAAVKAQILQHSTLTVDGDKHDLIGPSSMVRCTAATAASNGGVPIVADTTTNTGGTANLVTAAVNGGWIRVSPHKAIRLYGKNAVKWNQDSPYAEAVALPGDMTVETWFRPGAVTTETARPRLATYNRKGNIDYPNEPIQWALGLQPAPSLHFNDSTFINGSYALAGSECTLQIHLMPRTRGGSGPILQLTTTGISASYLQLAVDAEQRVVATYAEELITVTSRAALAKEGTWTQVTVTLADVGAKTMALRLYFNGVLQGEREGAKSESAKVPGKFTVGAANGAYPMDANGASMWARALPPDEVALRATNAPPQNDPGLVISWPLIEGHGDRVTNLALDGHPQDSPIHNPEPETWSRTGAYAQAWAANRGYEIAASDTPLLGGWHHVAAAYRTAFALSLDGSQYADCGNDPSLDFGSTFSMETWFTTSRAGAVQTLISKSGNYELGLNYDSTVELRVPTTSLGATPITVTTGQQGVVTGRPYYVAATVTTGATKANDSNPQGLQVQKYFVRAHLYIDGVLAGSFVKEDYADPVDIATSESRLNVGRSSAGAAYFTGLVSDVRLWNKVLSASTIAQAFQSHRVSSSDGLVSSWRWTESRGKFSYDDNNLNNAVLTSNDLWHLYPSSSILTLVVDGAEQAGVVVKAVANTADTYGVEQFTAGAGLNANAALTDFFTGEMSELRVWNRERTPEQIREGMYRPLTGTEVGLAGCWPFNTGSGTVAEDATGHNFEGSLVPVESPPAWVAARAPISNEAKEVYNVLGGLPNEFIAQIHGIPSTAEYGDTRRDAYGTLYSVMKRCYGAAAGPRVDLYSGFVVGDLDTTYAGQVQTAPSLVGFIEGAPPIPSENQTNPWWNDVNYLNTYAENTTVRLVQAQTTIRAFSGSEHTSDASSVDGKVGVYLSTSASQSIGLGIEAEYEAASIEGHLGVSFGTSTERGQEKELAFGMGKTTTFTDELSAGGEWEHADAVLNPAVGRRYEPENFGYALVKSLTADLYLVTLKGSNAVVKMTLVPDADIPEDVNIISFPIDPRYTKNGTLDGMVGFVQDPSFPYANLQPSSYFRPLEAYNLKRSIERQDKQLEAYYQQFDTTNLSKAASLGAGAGPDSPETGFTKFRDKILPSAPSYNWQKSLAKRSVVNTYVWSANGGLHSEQSELIDTYSESFAGTSSWEMTNGAAFDLAAAMIAGLYTEFDALASSSIEVMSMRNKESESGFGLEVEFAPDRYLKRPIVDSNGQPGGYTENDAPGKVTGYRFMSFFVPPSENNFEKFTSQVIDQNWLQNSGDANAAALRTATVQTNGAWRVLHRVTYVSRVPASLQPATADTTPPPVVPPANLTGNTLITALIEKQINRPQPSPSEVGAAVALVLGDSTDDPGLMSRLLPWWMTFLGEAADPRSEAHRTLVQLRSDLLGYMVQKYATATAQAGGRAIAQLRMQSMNNKENSHGN
jgi:hypothetical protein